MSNHAIAKEAGISEPTVRRARASYDAPERIGQDGKSYPARRTFARWRADLIQPKSGSRGHPQSAMYPNSINQAYCWSFAASGMFGTLQ